MSSAPRLLVVDRGMRDQPVSYSQDWIDAFRKHSGARVDVLSNPLLLKWGRRLARLTLSSQYDGIFIMHSVFNDYSFGYSVGQVLSGVRGPVFVFLGNEYRGLAAKVDLANELRCSVLLSQLPGDAAEKLYGPFFTGKVVGMPHALNEEAFQSLTPMKDRAIDLGYRGEKYPYYLGHDERDQITNYFSRLAKDRPLKLDIAAGRGTGKRLAREGWAAFLNSCRCAIGTETGAEHLSMSDKLRYSVHVYLEKKPAASMSEVQTEVIAPLVATGAYVRGRAISSRHFDAIGAGTALVSFSGRFNDILKADEHYIRLNRDFSNVEEVLSKIFDDKYLEDLTGRTRNMVLQGHCLKHRVRLLMEMR